MSRSWKIAVSQRREHGGEWWVGGIEGVREWPLMLVLQEKGPSSGRPAAPTLLPWGGGVFADGGGGAGGGSAPPLSEITVDTCQALRPRDRARLIQATWDNGLQAHSEA